MATIAKKSTFSSTKKSPPNQPVARPGTKTAQALALAPTHTVSQIAAKLGSTTWSVRHLLAEKGVKAVKASQAKVVPAEKLDRNAAAVAAVVAGETQTAVAARFGISNSLVSRLVGKLAPDFKPATRGAALKNAIVADAGRPYGEIAARHGVTADYVGTVLRLSGYPVKKKTLTDFAAELAPTHTAREISEVLQRPVTAIRTMLRTRGVKAQPSAYKPVPPVRKKAPVAKKPATTAERVVELAPTRTVTQIASDLRISRKRVRLALKRAGVTAKDNRRFNAPAGRAIDPNSLASRIVGLAAANTVEGIAVLVGKGNAYVRAALKQRGVRAKDPIVIETDVSDIPEFLKRPHVDLFAMRPVPPAPIPAVNLPQPLEVARAVNAHGRDEAAERWPRVSPTLIDSLLAEGRLMIADEQARLDAIDKAIREDVKVPAAKLAPAATLGEPKPDFVAEVVARHGLSGACELWPHIEADEIDRLARIGTRRIPAPSDDLPLDWVSRLWSAVKRAFGRS